MHAYLNMTLEEARWIVQSGQSDYWAEARLAKSALEEVNSHSAEWSWECVTFVRADTVPKGVKIQASRGQLIVVTAPGHSRKPIFNWGAPINYKEPIVGAIAKARLLESIRQPKPKRQTVDSSAKPATFALDRPQRA